MCWSSSVPLDQMVDVAGCNYCQRIKLQLNEQKEFLFWVIFIFSLVSSKWSHNGNIHSAELDRQIAATQTEKDVSIFTN